jgi:tetratricopeptide (TPR) repeat protein
MWTFWTICALIVALTAEMTVVAAEMPMPPVERSWREPLDRAEAALAEGQARRAELAWEEAHRAAMRASIPPNGLINVGIAYLRIGEAARDRQTAVARARQLFLRAFFRARDQRDIDGIAAVSQAFASLGDCEMSERAFAVALTMAPQRGGTPPSCERIDLWRPHPSASPRQIPIPPALRQP